MSPQLRRVPDDGDGSAAQCARVRCQLSAHLDETLAEPERQAVQDHLLDCVACTRESQTLLRNRAALRSLPRRVAPGRLSLSLRVMASQEAARRRAHADWRSLLAHYRGHLRLWRDNLMRPFAIPATGGLLSTVLLFSAIVPHFTIATVSANSRNDIPTVLSTGATIKTNSVPLGFHQNEVIVEITIDESGRMVDYSFPNGEGRVRDPALRRTIENYLLFAQFEPATAFGQPTSGKLRLSFRHSHIDVKG